MDRGLWTALCQCETPNCPDLHLTLEDITPLEANRAKLGRALCKPLLLNSKPAQLGLPYTAQIGSWSADAVPVILTIQCDRRDFRRVLAELVARLHRPFILFAPTSAHLDAACQELLAHARAAFFALESIVLLTDHGTLHPKKPPGELFAQFTPQPKEAVGEDVAQQTFALVKALDSERKVRKAPPFTVFLLYCMEGLSATEIAKRCRCTSRLVFTRLKWLGTKLGRDPAELRQYSAQFESIEKSLSDPRARNLYRKGAAYGDDTEQEADE